MSRIYLDHAATSPMRPPARAAVADGMARWANPSSPHAEGRAARRALEDAREQIRRALGWRGELIFTSGASEAALIALGRSRRPVLASAVEHDAIHRAAPARLVPVDAAGLVRADLLGEALREMGPALVAIQHANSETGVLQPIGSLAAVVQAAGGLLLADCSQSAGKLPLPDADLAIVSAHKLGGPPGIGALLARDLAMLEPAGGQEFGYRGGTENLPGALGFAAALATPDWHAGTAALRADLDRAIRDAGGEVVADTAPRVATIAAYRMPGVSAAAQLIRLDAAGFAVSAGSACSSGSLRPSPVLAAMGYPHPEEVIRVSFGWSTTEDNVAAFARQWRAIAGRAAAA